jgi:hypothetical protein
VAEGYAPVLAVPVASANESIAALKRGQVECGVTSLGLSAMLALVNALAGAVFDA